MKKQFIIAIAFLGTLAVSCNTQEPEEAVSFRPEFEEFFATTEAAEDPGTKTLADDQYHVLWHADDRVSIFNKYTYNQEYAFTGETGANAGGFRKASTDEFITGSEIDNIYAVYPYQQGTRISTDGTLTVNLPAEQMWAEKSFGRGANTMIAATTDNRITFKNVGGILILKLYGSNTQVQSVTLRGNSGEKLAGKAAVTMPVGSVPSMQMQPDATDAITLACESPVTLGTSSSEYTEFWFVVPPTEFTNGFTITVTSTDGGTFEKATDKSISISRNGVSKMAPIEVRLGKPAAEPEWVDLGLSVKWATFNVGATKPEEYGDYFAWGETEPKDNYYWTTYLWCKGYNNTLTKYNTDARVGIVDNRTVLTPDDDVASISWGSGWRMPTTAEWVELLDNCTGTWTDEYNGTGVAGTIIKSNKTGFTDKYIFLPATGIRDETDIYSAGAIGFYWSSSINAEIPYFAFGVSIYKYCSQNHNDRAYGYAVRPVYGEFNEVTAISLDKTSLELYPGGSEQVTAIIHPANATAKDVHWASSDNEVATVDENGLIVAVASGSTTVTAYGSSGVSASCTITVTEKTSIGDYEYVDLGLSVKWATCNVGASKPDEYGDYFAWGETETKSEYKWSTYKWCNGFVYRLTKYNYDESYGSVDGKSFLDREDDAAHVIMGNSWRLPTVDEWTELRENTTYSWTDNYNDSGVAGIVLSSNRTGYTDKFIFLPAAGVRSGSDLICSETEGSYWAASLDMPSTARGVLFDSKQFIRCCTDRHYGLPVRPVNGKFNPVVSIFLDKTTLEIYPNNKYQLTSTVSPSNATEKIVHWTSSDKSVAIVSDSGLVSAVALGTATITAYASNGVSAACVVKVKTKTDTNGHEYVDLGLPSGLKWATMNMGSSKPEEYGDHFAWGETEPKANYSWSTYKFELGTDYKGPFSKYVTNTSYGTVDNKIVLDPEDDAASGNWGGTWRMPTDADWKELINNCTWAWTDNYNGMGVAGTIVTSNRTGYTGKSIFLPAAGRQYGTYTQSVGSDGYYWSSSLYENSCNSAYLTRFESGYVGRLVSDRECGYSVRPVSE